MVPVSPQPAQSGTEIIRRTGSLGQGPGVGAVVESDDPAGAERLVRAGHPVASSSLNRYPCSDRHLWQPRHELGRRRLPDQREAAAA